MRNLLCCCALVLLVLGLAHAAPTPQDVDREIRAGHYDQALVMLADVRRERPLSATAEWLTASALYGRGDVQEAGTHLAAARQLDPALTGASPARVAQIEGALRGQERAGFGRTLALVLGVLALIILAAVLIRRAHRARQRQAARAEALDGLYRRVKAREDEIEAEQLGLKIAALTDPSAKDRLRKLEDEAITLWAELSEVQDGPVEAMAAYPGPRPRTARRATPSAPASPRPGSAAASSPRVGPATSRISSAAPVTVVQGGSSSGDLLSGVLLGQALTSSPEPARPDPAPVPERRVEAAPPSWENPSSLTEDRKPSWEAPSSLSSGASYENSSSLSSSSSDSSPSSTDTSSSGSSDTSSTSSSDW